MFTRDELFTIYMSISERINKYNSMLRDEKAEYEEQLKTYIEYLNNLEDKVIKLID